MSEALNHEPTTGEMIFLIVTVVIALGSLYMARGILSDPSSMDTVWLGIAFVSMTVNILYTMLGGKYKVVVGLEVRDGYD